MDNVVTIALAPTAQNRSPLTYYPDKVILITQCGPALTIHQSSGTLGYVLDLDAAQDILEAARDLLDSSILDPDGEHCIVDPEKLERFRVTL